MNTENKKDEVKEAIIKALSDKIVQEIATELNLPTGQNSDASVRVEPSTKVVRYLVHKLAELRYEHGVEMKKKAEDW
jgi:hypothetical protein